MSKTITRRALLQGAGVAMSLPWLESLSSMAQAQTVETLSEPPRRLAYLFWPNGVRPDFWTPPGDGEEFELSTPHLKPFAPLKDDIMLVENLWNPMARGRNGHWPKIPAWLTGGRVHRTAGNDLNCGAQISVDQLVGQRLGDQTPLPTLELGIDSPRTGIDAAGGGFARAYGSFMSWRDERTPIPKEIIPRLAFDRLFRNNRSAVVSSLNPDDPALVQALQRDDSSILDAVLEQAKDMKRKGSVSDGARLDEFFDSVRSVERRLDAAIKPQRRWINAGTFPLDRPAPGVPQSHAEHVKLMLDILALALWSDTTRVATFMFGDAQTMQNYSFLTGNNGGFHSISHHNEDPNQREHYTSIINWHTQQVADFLTKLKSLDEAGTPLLDNCMILCGASLKDGNRHLEKDLPLLLAGHGKGTLKPGRRVRAPKDTPMCNLHLAMLNRMGVEDESFGDSTGPLDGLS